MVPKGWPIKGLKPPQSAAREAYEEAGVRGAITGKAIGSFTYDKHLDEGRGEVPCEVKLFPLLVKRQLKSWPEMAEREWRWFDAESAAALVEEASLKTLIRDFAAKRSPSPDGPEPVEHGQEPIPAIG